MKHIFEFNAHLDFLSDRLNAKAGSRGSKKRLAEYLGIQPAFLSQVLAGKYHLSLEQADLANRFFDHSPEESHYFLLLVNRDRAGTSSLRAYFDEQIQAALKKRLEVIERLGKRSAISKEAEAIYYSSWIYAGIQICCAIPAMNTQRAVANSLSLPVHLTGKALDFLVDNNLLVKRGEHYDLTKTWIRLGADSPHIVKHHTHWRQKAIQNLELQSEEDLHYSGVYAIDKKTMLKVKDETLSFIKLLMKDIEPAKEELVAVLGVDFFNLTKRP